MKETLRKIILGSVPIWSLVVLAPFAAWAAGTASSNVSLDNPADAKKFLQTVKRDLFYLPDEKFQAPARDDDQSSPQRDKTGADQQKQPDSAVPVKNADEDFRVEGIIRVGRGGCAIINSKIWYFEKPNMGYKIVEMSDEYVNIKTPDGRVIKCDLIRQEKTLEQ